MKFTKILFAALAAVAVFLCANRADAQMYVVPTANATTAEPGSSGVYVVINGTVGIPAATTNTFYTTTSTNSSFWPQGYNKAANTNLLLLPATQYQTALLTVSFTQQASSTAAINVYQSDDLGQTFIPTPIFSAVGIAGTGLYGTNATLTIPPGSTLAFAIGNSGTAYITNGYAALTLIAPKYGSVPATH